MSNVTLVIGESGSGKSTAIRNLVPSETFIINVIGKPLPFRGFRKDYITIGSDALQGNYYESDNFEKIIRLIKVISEKRQDIKTLIVDDFQYTMCNEFMNRATEKGYSKFTEIGKHAWQIINELSNVDSRVQCYVLSHSDVDNEGKYKIKTIGKMLEEKISLEGMFTIVLHSLVIDGQYKFLTQYDGKHIAKSPMGLFPKYVDNDLLEINAMIDEYYNGDIDIEEKVTTHVWRDPKDSIPEEAIGYGPGHPIQGEVTK